MQHARAHSSKQPEETLLFCTVEERKLRKTDARAAILDFWFFSLDDAMMCVSFFRVTRTLRMLNLGANAMFLSGNYENSSR